MNLTLIYFDLPVWRAEVPKISLFMSDIPFDNRIISFEEFHRVRETGRLDDGTSIPFHQLPCLVANGTSIVQTGAIARFCGKLSGLYPVNDIFAAAAIDQFIDLATDITELLFSMGRDVSDDIKKLKREQLIGGELGKKLAILESNICSDGTWTTSNQLSIADIAIWRLMGWLSSGSLEGIPTDILLGFPKINRVCSNVEAEEKVKEWINLTYPKSYERGNFFKS